MKSTQELIEAELLELCQEGRVEAFLVLNDEGIPLAEVGDFEHYNKDAVAALSVLLNQSATLLADFHEGLTTNEASLRTSNDYRIVSRPFHVEDVQFMLVAILPQQCAYRHITTQAVQKIQALMLN